MAGTEISKRPRLSLQTKPSPGPGRAKGSLANVDPRSPTAFNTLTNLYVTAIERSTPTQSTPITAINLLQPLKLQTDPESLKARRPRVEIPYAATLPDTPLSANPVSPSQQIDMVFPSTMTSTPPLSAGAVESSNNYTFAPGDVNKQESLYSPTQTRRRVVYAPFASPAKAPYSHNKSLHSILRNSPLAPASDKSPISPRRQSRRLQEKAARHVGYLSPLTQTITTEKYIKSHVELLAEDASPYTPSPAAEDSDMILDLALAYTGSETRDGGETPGPFEEMRRRMTGLGTETPITSPRPDGIRKRKRKEKKRKWVWTIGQDDEEKESGAIAALKAAVEESTPRPSAPFLPPLSTAGHTNTTLSEPQTAVQISFESVESSSDLAREEMDIEMSDSSSISSSRATTPPDIELEMKTSTGTTLATAPSKVGNLDPADLIDPETGSRRDSPIPPDLVSGKQ
ncbi:uncharacterized protein F4812DRAFT_456017 [Daldinia caldariorum]|uniref:uncharacterized protein n=1 Tax=Daldinia caldariorum TaxID=326644 RepID=UPI002008A4DA|nr:uncharacterized protein F4812DRAFT_456017 [Daldinia caldariorum]KAI1471914.1 hypothetical protein F4812DRAFT_456017 [Daldinia caldariorum]